MQIQRIRETEDHENQILNDYLAAKSAFDQAQRHLEQMQQALIDDMQEHQVKSLKVTANGVLRSVTFVQRETPTIDEKGLRKALTAKVYDRYTVKKLDRKQLETAMDAGELDPMVVLRFVEMKKSKPYLNYTERASE